MFALRPLFLLTAAASAFAIVAPRQATNTNPAILAAVKALDVQINKISPQILTLQAGEKANDSTIKPQVDALSSAFSNATTTLKGIAVSSGSTTVSPTNDDISVIFGDVMQGLASTFSGLNNLTVTVPSLQTFLSALDPVVAGTTIQLNTTIPATTSFIHILMLDAEKFFQAEQAWPQTLAALGF